MVEYGNRAPRFWNAVSGQGPAVVAHGTSFSLGLRAARGFTPCAFFLVFRAPGKPSGAKYILRGRKIPKLGPLTPFRQIHRMQLRPPLYSEDAVALRPGSSPSDWPCITGT